MDVTTMNPAHVVVYSIIGFGNPNDTGALFMLGAGTEAARAMISHGNSLLNGTNVLDQVVNNYTGNDKSKQIPTDDADWEKYKLPDGTGPDGTTNTMWSQYAINQWIAHIASKMGDDKDKNALLNSYVNAWNSQSSLQSTQKDAASGEINSWTKGEQSKVSEAQSNIQAASGLGQSAIGTITYGANMISQPM